MILIFMVTTKPRDDETSVRRLVGREGGRPFHADLAELLLVERDVVREGFQELLGVQRSHDGPAVDLHVWTPGNDPAQVDHELAGRMDDVREVDVLTLRAVVIER